MNLGRFAIEARYRYHSISVYVYPSDSLNNALRCFREILKSWPRQSQVIGALYAIPGFLALNQCWYSIYCTSPQNKRCRFLLLTRQLFMLAIKSLWVNNTILVYERMCEKLVWCDTTSQFYSKYRWYVAIFILNMILCSMPSSFSMYLVYRTQYIGLKYY